MGSIAANVQTPRPTCDHARDEMRALQKDSASALGHRRLRPPHYAGNRLRPLGVGDHQIVGIQRNLGIVKQPQRFASGCAPDIDVTSQPGVVKRVQRLAQLEHHIVGDVDHHRDAAQARALDAATHPRRRGRGGVHVGEHTPQIDRAVAGCGHAYATRLGVLRLDIGYRHRLHSRP